MSAASPPAAVTRAASVDAAYRQIRAAIVEGTYASGERLVEQRLADELAVSRTPLREALRRLEAEGLVVIEPNRGASVRALTVDDVVDLYELRARLEGYAAERAASRRTAEQLTRLDEALAGFEAATRSPAARTTPSEPGLAELRELNVWNSAFHAVIVEAAAHVRLDAILARTVDHPLVFEAFRRFDPDELARSATFHRLVRDAIAAGDTRRAGLLLEEHVMQGRDVLLATLGSAGQDAEQVAEAGVGS